MRTFVGSDAFVQEINFSPRVIANSRSCSRNVENGNCLIWKQWLNNIIRVYVNIQLNYFLQIGGMRTNKELPRIPPVDVNLVSSVGRGGGGSVPVQETILE